MSTTTHPRSTRNGRALAHKLNPAIGTTTAIIETCSLIARHTRTHHGLTEMECNGVEWLRYDTEASFRARQERIETWVAHRVEQIERRITQLVNTLPETDEGPIGVVFSGDPRGATVKLVMPGTLTRLHDDWGQVGICV